MNELIEDSRMPVKNRYELMSKSKKAKISAAKTFGQ